MSVSRKERKKGKGRERALKGVVLMPVLVMGIAVLLSAAAASLAAVPGTDIRAYTVAGEKQVSDRYGVVSSNLAVEPATIAAEFQKMDEAGIQWVRTQFAWSDIEKTQGNWSYSGHDSIVDNADALGMKVLGILISAPRWANAAGDNPAPFTLYPPTPDDPIAQAAWLDYVERVCTEYAGRVDAWEVWNEPDNAWSWGGGPVNPEAYCGLLKISKASRSG